MGRIKDGGGLFGDAKTSKDQRLNTSARSNDRIYYVSRDDARAFSLVSNDAAAAAGEITFQMKNTSTTRRLIIHDIHFYSIEACTIKLSSATGVAAAGTVLTAANLNFGSGFAAELEAMSGSLSAITGMTAGTLVGYHKIPAADTLELTGDSALILLTGDQFIVEYDAGTTGAFDINVTFYYEDFDA